jgi:hypothetical protein
MTWVPIPEPAVPAVEPDHVIAPALVEAPVPDIEPLQARVALEVARSAPPVSQWVAESALQIAQKVWNRGEVSRAVLF